MALPLHEGLKINEGEGLDTLSGPVAEDQSGFPSPNNTKVTGFVPQPPAGLDLSVMDPLPNETGHSTPKSDPE